METEIFVNLDMQTWNVINIMLRVLVIVYTVRLLYASLT